ncbi:hypothetical protein C8R45DRAFT_1076556 [Mycena sanguinolenta]|nr:hypothetical protein C8R45DRAFT_1076556 [Mycena sanguinolenta]
MSAFADKTLAAECGPQAVGPITDGGGGGAEYRAEMTESLQGRPPWERASKWYDAEIKVEFVKDPPSKSVSTSGFLEGTRIKGAKAHCHESSAYKDRVKFGDWINRVVAVAQHKRYHSNSSETTNERSTFSPLEEKKGKYRGSIRTEQKRVLLEAGLWPQLLVTEQSLTKPGLGHRFDDIWRRRRRQQEVSLDSDLAGVIGWCSLALCGGLSHPIKKMQPVVSYESRIPPCITFELSHNMKIGGITPDRAAAAAAAQLMHVPNSMTAAVTSATCGVTLWPTRLTLVLPSPSTSRRHYRVTLGAARIASSSSSGGAAWCTSSEQGGGERRSGGGEQGQQAGDGGEGEGGRRCARWVQHGIIVQRDRDNSAARSGHSDAASDVATEFAHAATTLRATGNLQAAGDAAGDREARARPLSLPGFTQARRTTRCDLIITGKFRPCAAACAAAI